MKKKILISLLAQLSLLSMSLNSFAENNTGLTDISESHWSYNSIEKLVKKYNFKIGYPDKTFKGDKNLTRYEVASLIVQILEQMPKKNLQSDDLNNIKDLSIDYSKEINEIKNDINKKFNALEDQLDSLQAESERNANIFENFMSAFPFIINGDIGFRYQLNTQNLGQDFKNQVHQSRVSLSIDSKEISPIGYGVRILTGGADRVVNTWWKTADFFARLPINLDRAFVIYRPVNFFDITLGKFRDPFANSELYMDEEISPQGALQSLRFNDLNSVIKELSFTAGEYVITMDKSETPIIGNTYSLNGNADLKLNLTDMIGLNLRGGYYHYIGANNIAKANIAPANLPTGQTFTSKITGNSNANTLTSDGNYKANFNIVNGFAKLIFRLNDRFPLSLSTDYLYNLGTTQDNMAYQISAKIGNTKDQGHFFLGYNFKHLQADASISLFVEDQLGSTNVQAHEGIFGIKLFPNTILSATFQARNGIKTVGNTNYTFRTNLIQSF